MSLSVKADTWDVVESKNTKTGNIIIFRYVKKFLPTFKRSKQPVRAIITWKYKSENGMPHTIDNSRMIEFEDILQPALIKNGLSTLVLVSTGDGLKEWIYYTKTEDKFLRQLNNTLKYSKPLPIQIHIANDPTWKSFEEFRFKNKISGVR